MTSPSEDQKDDLAELIQRGSINSTVNYIEDMLYDAIKDFSSDIIRDARERCQLALPTHVCPDGRPCKPCIADAFQKAESSMMYSMT